MWTARGIAGWLSIGLVVLTTCGTGMAWAAQARPNFLIIMADDLGYSDLGCYGGEIETPRLDELARRGLRLSQFMNTAKCHSSRVSLLTGCYCMQAGDQALTRAVTSAEVLRAAGYSTLMTGKWHLDKEPTDFGFDRYFGHLSGSTNYFVGNNSFRLDGQPFAVPAQGFYTTVANVDYGLQFLTAARQVDQPWYLYVAFNAPHAPLQPLREDYEKYRDRYRSGWDVTRAARVQKQQDLHLLGPSVEPSPRPAHIPAWTDLAADRQDWEARRMAALAGMIDRVDREVGRLVDDLKAHGEFDNTLILFVSDNGACPYDRTSRGMDREPWDSETTWGDSTGWAWARNTPFRFYKQNQYEGGISSPAIISWPAGLKTNEGAIVHEPAHLIDVLPTLAELAQTSLPQTWPGRQLSAVSGVSLVPLLQGKSLGARPPIHLLFSQDRGLRDGEWKITSFQSQPWELYHLSEDRTELHDLAADQPDRLAKMVAAWHDMAEHVLQAPPNSRRPVATEREPYLHREWTDFNRPLKGTQEAPGARASRRNAPAASSGVSLRVRKNTQAKLVDGKLEIKLSAADGGLAIDHLPQSDLPGPYQLKVRMKSAAGPAGLVFYTTDAKTPLPNGTQVKFTVTSEDSWQEQIIPLNSTAPIYAVRFDPGNQAGEVSLAVLDLCAADGTLICHLLVEPARAGRGE